MPTLLQINVTANWGSTGKIAEDIGKVAIDAGWESWVAYGRGKPESASNLIRIGNDFDMRLHGLQTRLFDNHGLASRTVTKAFVKKVKELRPDIIHLHNIHGYYLNYPILFDFLKQWGGPVIWTLHDCWPFTGHCAFHEYAKCDRWQSLCHDCPQLRSFPASLLMDRSEKNHLDKQRAFALMPNLTFIPVSNWLRGELSQSFLGGYRSFTIHNGINLSTFHFDEHVKFHAPKKNILGVASVWDKRKGLDEFVKLRRLLPDDYTITLVGLSGKQIASLPEGITGISRTENVDQLVELYTKASVFVNPTLEDNFPTTNIEALACGTPVITYNTGGSPEAIDDNTGFIVPYQDVDALAEKVMETCENNTFSPHDCRVRAEKLFDQQQVFQQYISLYNSLLQK